VRKQDVISSTGLTAAGCLRAFLLNTICGLTWRRDQVASLSRQQHALTSKQLGYRACVLQSVYDSINRGLGPFSTFYVPRSFVDFFLQDRAFYFGAGENCLRTTPRAVFSMWACISAPLLTQATLRPKQVWLSKVCKVELADAQTELPYKEKTSSAPRFW
jgi:hypothetical protein